MPLLNIVRLDSTPKDLYLSIFSWFQLFNISGPNPLNIFPGFCGFLNIRIRIIPIIYQTLRCRWKFLVCMLFVNWVILSFKSLWLVGKIWFQCFLPFSMQTDCFCIFSFRLVSRSITKIISHLIKDFLKLLIYINTFYFKIK